MSGFGASGPATTTASVRGEIDPTVLEERRRALRTLLELPLLVADGPRGDDLILVRRHRTWLRDWLAKNAGWTLQVSSELARLHKIPARLDDVTRPAREPKSKTPFSRRRYVLFCLALAALEGADRQTTLGWLADRIVQFTVNDPDLARAGLRFELEDRKERRDLVQVVRLLLELRVLVRLDGDEELYLKERGDVLYNVLRPTLAAVLSVGRGPSTIDADDFEERLAALVEEPLPESEEARRRRRRHHLGRRLLDDPVVFYAELEEDEREYLQKQRPHLLGRLQEATGLLPEVRREGIALVDERDELTDLKMPERGTDGHLTLLLAEHLAASARRDAAAGIDPPRAVGLAALEAETVELARHYSAYWRGSAKEPGAEKGLVRQAVERLEALGLVRRTADGDVVPRPAIGRFALDEPRFSGVEKGETLDLFAEPEA